jgi:hypothetical protein
MTHPSRLIVVTDVERIDQDLQDRARALALESQYEFADHCCVTNSWFAALAAVSRGDKDVLLVAGFRKRGGRSWREDAHCWISVGGKPFEPSPENDPSGVAYLQLWTRIPNDATKAEVFAKFEDMFEKLKNWAATQP